MPELPTPDLHDRIPSEPYPGLSGVLGRLVEGVRGILGEDLVGIYLVGSLATGGFDLDSDVDFLAVMRGELQEGRIGSLQDMHQSIHEMGCYPARHLEGSYMSQKVLEDPENVGMQPVWYIDNGSTVLERSTHDNRWHVRWVLREQGIALTGPEPGELLDPVPEWALRTEALEMMQGAAEQYASDIRSGLTYWSSRFGQSFAVLTFCRMLFTVKTGTVVSKQEGITWALENLDPAWAHLIRSAWKEREGVRFCTKIRQRADQADLDRTLSFIEYAMVCGRLVHSRSTDRVERNPMKYHHLGIPSSTPNEGETYLEAFDTYATDHEANPYGIQWMRYGPGCTLPEIVRSTAHLAFEVEDLEKAIDGKEVIIHPNSPSEGVRVAFILVEGVPIEFLEFDHNHQDKGCSPSRGDDSE